MFTCKDLSYAFDYPEEENNEEKSSEGDPENSDVAKSNSTPEDVMAEFFHTNTVKQASWLALSEMYDFDHREMRLTLRLGRPATPNSSQNGFTVKMDSTESCTSGGNSAARSSWTHSSW